MNPVVAALRMTRNLIAQGEKYDKALCMAALKYRIEPEEIELAILNCASRRWVN